jgi:hypothetical protein
MTDKTITQINSLLKREFSPAETLKQITHFGGFRFLSWGTSQKTNFKDKALILKVNGHHFKGYVVITLDWSDTYDVNLITTHGNITKTFNMVYFDDLFDVIDKAIEYVPEYTR